MTESVVITDAAAAHLLKVMDHDPDAKLLRLAVQKSGCSGLRYVNDLVASAQPQDLDLPAPGGLKAVIDPEAIEYLRGMTLDLIKIGPGQTKLTYINPNATMSCGCGESFSIDSAASEDDDE